MKAKCIIKSWKNQEKMKRKNKYDFSGLYLLSQLGYAGITPILVGVFLGDLLDKKLGTDGIFMIIFIIIGSVAGIINLYKIASDYSKRK